MSLFNTPLSLIVQISNKDDQQSHKILKLIWVIINDDKPAGINATSPNNIKDGKKLKTNQNEPAIASAGIKNINPIIFSIFISLTLTDGFIKV